MAIDTSKYYGIDSNTSSFPSTIPSTKWDFYIGELGKGISTVGAAFNDTGAKKAQRVYAYWYLYGPKNDPSYPTSAYSNDKATAWGTTQAQNAINARINKVNSYPTLKLTMFGDVERDVTQGLDLTKNIDSKNGWLVPSENVNAYLWNKAVIKGFMSRVAAQGLPTGIYTGSGPWNAITGLNLENPMTYANYFWQSEYTVKSFNADPPAWGGANKFNGTTVPMIWQYYGDMTTGDANIAQALPN
jgi:hypothetical protein